jgi:transmembrane sensor
VTNVVGFEAPASIQRQAREWLIRLDGDEPLSEEEHVALRDWLARSPAHREELLRVSRFWHQANTLTELAVPLEPRVPRSKARNWRHPGRFLAAASVVLVSVLVTLWWVQSANQAANGTYATAIGQQETIALPDGSSVQLNTDSQIEVSYGAGWRRLRLLRGEALFSVAPDRSKPFQVYAADSMVRALGTAFVVRLIGGSVDVTVTKGVVEVGSSGVGADEQIASQHAAHARRTQVRAGQMTMIDRTRTNLDVRQLPDSELARRTAWHEGFLDFSGEPLSEVVAQVNRYSPVAVEIADPKLKSLAIGGRFRIGDLEAVLDALHTNFGIQSRHLDEHNIVLEPDASGRH